MLTTLVQSWRDRIHKFQKNLPIALNFNRVFICIKPAKAYEIIQPSYDTLRSS